MNVIGRGGLGTVYRARDESLGRDVAVKIFAATATAEDDIRVQEYEVNILAGLNHHSLVTLFDAGLDRTEPERPHIYIVMELVEGADLKAQLEDGPLTPRRIAQIGFDLAEGIEYLQQRGIVHRDIKPANILLAQHTDASTRSRAKLTDFGIALEKGRDRAADANVTGTAAYLSPEQARGEALSSASDIYSLGLVLLECFTGEVTFPGPPIPAALARLRQDPVVPNDVPPTWRALLVAMTARLPANRPLINDLVLALQEAIMAETGRHKERDDRSALDEEAARTRAVERYQVLDSPPDGAFDRITAMAARVFEVPIAIVSIVDHDRIWFKSHHGLDIDQVDRVPGLCASAIMQDTPWVVADARLDPRAISNPLVAGDFGLQFYAGVPLRTIDGHNLGTLCVLDFEPRPVTDAELATLTDLAALVMSELELRLESRRALAELD
ncbi:GAF domain-containing protein [Cryobacterium adonitolivorans]|uniref:GAF domain-containing protein n=2 Tax=Cryobacterium adonitolivorans TaxID=1259189 RepID=A0A4V3ID03_9MICO|nr:GAF domain-containing protein [Cryobacterium adonitolivorans]